MALVYVLIGVVIGTALADLPRVDITLAELDGRCLPGDLDQPDQILFTEVNTTDSDSCVPANMVGLQLSSGEFATRWKGFYLHNRLNYNTYHQLLEHFDKQQVVTVLKGALSLQNDWDICLWKDVDEFIGWSHRNIYVVKDTSALQPGKLYRFHWLNDNGCV